MTGGPLNVHSLRLKVYGHCDNISGLYMALYDTFSSQNRYRLRETSIKRNASDLIS